MRYDRHMAQRLTAHTAPTCQPSSRCWPATQHGLRWRRSMASANMLQSCHWKSLWQPIYQACLNSALHGCAHLAVPQNHVGIPNTLDLHFLLVVTKISAPKYSLEFALHVSAG